ncbi:MAG: OmpH family outer membrane protein [Alphaproteobacteria bacterium]|nr:OmpH family outer membrane protein [Alphaproteobacteria bacterium]
MRKIAFAIAMLVAFAASAQKAEDFQPVRIGVVNSQKITENARVMKSINTQRDKLLDDLKASVEKKRKEFEAREGDLRTKRIALSPDAFQKEVAAFQKSVMDFDRSTQEREAAIRKGVFDAMKTVNEDHLEPIIREVGRKYGLDMVLSEAMTVLINNRLDLTDEVLKNLNDKIKDIKVRA